MALMNTLRNKMGKVVVGVIALAILSFVLTDLLGGQNSIFLNGNSRNVGEIAGESIDIEEYQKLVENMKLNYQNNFGRSPGESELRSLRDQAWQLLIVEKAFTKLYIAAGVEVSTEELFDMVQGKNISPDVQQIFVNPQTGQFDKERLIQTIANLNTTQQGRLQWTEFERNLIPSRLRIKYDNLLVKTSSATKQEAEREYQEQTSVVEAKYLYVPFYSIADSAVSVTDSELNAYINQHANDFKVEWSRAIKFITFPIIPTSEDSVFFRDELREIKSEFESVDDDSVYANVITDNPPYFQEFSINELPSILKSNLAILKKGDVIGPYIDNADYVLYKISEVFEDEMGYARASHILIKWEDETTEAKSKARTEALSILRQLQSGADFAEMAKDNSTDGGSAILGGDLDWFDSEKMVKPFSNAVFNATSKGLVPRLVESEFGFHIIEVTELPSYTKYKLAMIRRTIMPTDETRDKAYRKADFFAGTSSNLEDFNANAEKDSLIVLEADNISQNDIRITRLGTARQVVSWLFNSGTEGSVSDVFELDNQYLVVVMTEEVEEGTASLESVRLEVEKKVKDKKKGELLVKKLEELTGSLEERMAEFDNDASVYEASDLKLSAYSLPSVGTSPEAIGAVFVLANGAFSKPIITENGVVVMNLLNLTNAPEIADHTSYKNTLEQGMQSRSSYYISEAIKAWADIEDTRYKFY